MVKDLPPKLAEKIPRCKSRADHNTDPSQDDEEEHGRAERDQGNPDSLTRVM